MRCGVCIVHDALDVARRIVRTPKVYPFLTHQEQYKTKKIDVTLEDG